MSKIISQRDDGKFEFYFDGITFVLGLDEVVELETAFRNVLNQEPTMTAPQVFNALLRIPGVRDEIARLANEREGER
jgi:hypothetical protein